MRMRKRFFIMPAMTATLIIAANCGTDKSTPNPQPNPAKWTVLVYADGNNSFDSSSDGYSYCVRDIQNLEEVGSSNDVKVIAMLSSLISGDSAKYYRIEHFPNDTLNQISSPVLKNLGSMNMADPSTFRNFLLYGIQNYPAAKYILLIDDHGTGWKGSCVDQPHGGGSLISTTAMANAIEQVLSESASSKFEVMAFISPLMSMTEVAYELRNSANWFVASEITLPMQNLISSENWLAPLQNDPSVDGAVMAGSIAAAIDGEARVHGKSVQVAAINLSKINFVAWLVDQLASNINLHAGSYWSEVLDARSQAHNATYHDSAHVDLSEFAYALTREPHLANIDEIRITAESLTAAIYNAVPTNLTNIDGVPLYGLTIHLPSQRIWYDSTLYAELDFRNLNWSGFVSNFISESEGSGLLTTISGTVDWPSDTLSGIVRVFLDTLAMPSVQIMYSALVDTLTGHFSISFSLHDSLAIAFEGWDDVDMDSTADLGDGYGFWDSDSDNLWHLPEDMVTVHPGQTVSGINIRLATIFNRQVSSNLPLRKIK